MFLPSNYHFLKKNITGCSSLFKSSPETFSSFSWSFSIWRIVIWVTSSQLLYNIPINGIHSFVNFTLARSTEKLRASGKPSTWFPLERHVQKAVTNYLHIFLNFSETFFVFTPQIIIFWKFPADSSFHFTCHFEFWIPSTEALLYEETDFR